MRRKWFVFAGLAVAAAVVIVFWWLFYRGDTPAPVSTGVGLAQLQQDLATEEARGEESVDDNPQCRVGCCF